MENNIKNWIMDYAVIGRRRFYRREKIRFIQRIEQDIHQMGYKTSILSPEGSKGKAINLLIGDVKKADTIIIANYDTPVKSFGLYPYKPFDLRHRNIRYLLMTAVPLICVALVCFLYSTFFLRIEWLKGIFHWSDLWALLVYLIGIIAIVRYAKGIPNRRNLNRNSSGVIALLHTAAQLNDKQKEHSAFVLTDFGCINHLGDQMLKAYLETYDHKKFIVLDSICDPHDIAICYSTAFKHDIKKLNACIKRCEMNDTNMNIAHLYPNTLVFSSGKISNGELICPDVNTRKDIQIDPDRIEFIAKQISVLIR